MAQINLRSLQALTEYSNAELKLLASVEPAREYDKGDVLCTEGDPGRSCFVLATGSVDVVRTIDGDDKVLATLRAGAIVGQMSLVDRSPRSATVVAANYTVVLELTREVFERLLLAHSHLALRFQFQIAVAGIRQLRMATKRLAGILSEQARKELQKIGLKGEIKEVRRDQLLTVKAALTEWDMSLDELDQVRVSVPRGQVRADEAAFR